MNWPFDAQYNMTGIRMVMNGSMCLIGFHVRRPSCCAVGSPCLSAAYPCAYSWATIENSSTGAARRKLSSSANSDWGRGTGDGGLRHLVNARQSRHATYISESNDVA